MSWCSHCGVAEAQGRATHKPAGTQREGQNCRSTPRESGGTPTVGQEADVPCGQQWGIQGRPATCELVLQAAPHGWGRAWGVGNRELLSWVLFAAALVAEGLLGKNPRGQAAFSHRLLVTGQSCVEGGLQGSNSHRAGLLGGGEAIPGLGSEGRQGRNPHLLGGGAVRLGGTQRQAKCTRLLAAPQSCWGSQATSGFHYNKRLESVLTSSSV